MIPAFRDGTRLVRGWMCTFEDFVSGTRRKRRPTLKTQAWFPNIFVVANNKDNEFIAITLVYGRQAARDNIKAKNKAGLEQGRHLTIKKSDFEELAALDMKKTAAAILRSKVLTIHGTEDETIPVANTYEFDKVMLNNELVVVEGATHRFPTEPERLEVMKALNQLMEKNPDNHRKIGTGAGTGWLRAWSGCICAASGRSASVGEGRRTFPMRC
ncbi:unnamed protein product [Ectocarpus sp. 12 AP-2014]